MGIDIQASPDQRPVPAPVPVPPPPSLPMSMKVGIFTCEPDILSGSVEKRLTGGKRRFCRQGGVVIYA